MIYFDHAASSPEFPEVRERMMELSQELYYNPSSRHLGGLEAERGIQAAKGILACDLGCQAEQLVVTSGATESVNTAFFQLGPSPKRKNEIIYSEVDHAAVLEAGKRQRLWGFETRVLPVDPRTHGMDMTALEAALSERTALVSLLLVNNETGAILDLPKYLSLIRNKAPEALIHLDAVQAWQKLPLTLEAWGVDFVSLAGHKIRGPKGIGLLFVRDRNRFHPLIVGGGQQHGLRSGTENPILVGGLARAVECWAERGSIQAREARYRELREALFVALDTRGMRYRCHEAEAYTPSIINLAIEGTRGETMVNFLGAMGFCVSNSSACSAGTKDGSKVLAALGIPSAEALASLRLSFDLTNTKEEIESFTDAVKEAMMYF